MARDDNGGGFFAGFIFGGILGAALALLFAPQPGSETQQMIREKGIELKERVSDITPEDAKQAMREAVEEGKHAAQRTREEWSGRVQDKAEDLKDQAKKTAEDWKSEAEKKTGEL